MLTIYKYPVPVQARFTLSIPADAEFLSVQTQKGSPQMWMTVEPGNPLEERAFAVYGTGHSIGEDYMEFYNDHNYLGTFLTDEGDFVGHLFEIV